MAAIGNEPEIPSTTEDVPAAPGWVEQEVDEIMADPRLGLPQRPSMRGHRNAYLDCLAAASRREDIDESHDRCRRAMLGVLTAEESLLPDLARTLEARLEALEAEISAQI